MRRHRRCFAILSTLLLLSLLATVGWTQRAPAVMNSCKVRRIIDGDTIECVVPARRVPIRLLGIDAPEMRQRPFGPQAKLFLEQLLPVHKSIVLEMDVRKTDRYGRLLAYVWNDSATMINEELLRAGFALVDIEPPNVRYAERFRSAAATARDARVGLWATSAFQCAPADFRRRKCP